MTSKSKYCLFLHTKSGKWFYAICGQWDKGEGQYTTGREWLTKLIESETCNCEKCRWRRKQIAEAGVYGVIDIEILKKKDPIAFWFYDEENGMKKPESFAKYRYPYKKGFYDKVKRKEQ